MHVCHRLHEPQSLRPALIVTSSYLQFCFSKVALRIFNIVPVLFSSLIMLTCLASKNICTCDASFHLSMRYGKYRAGNDGVPLLRNSGTRVCWKCSVWLIFANFWCLNACGIRNNV